MSKTDYIEPDLSLPSDPAERAAVLARLFEGDPAQMRELVDLGLTDPEPREFATPAKSRRFAWSDIRFRLASNRTRRARR